MGRRLTTLTPNIWDAVALVIVFGVFAAIAWGSGDFTAPLIPDAKTAISLEPANLPGYALATTLRMFIALFFSLLFTFIVAPLAAKNKHFEKVIIPFIDFMESIPILGFLAVAYIFFTQLFPNSRLGPECAAIFVIFTSQVWNMTLSLYQSLCTTPKDLIEVGNAFNLSFWQKFWRIEIPFALPGLLWNMMMSMSAGWFFIVFSEAIFIANQEILLPGIGSYISVAINNADLNAIGYAIATMFVVILIYDQILFRPLLSWSEKFKADLTTGEEYGSWFYALLAKTKLLKHLSQLLKACSEKISIPISFKAPSIPANIQSVCNRIAISIWNGMILIIAIVACGYILQFISATISLNEMFYVLYLGLITAAKVTILIIIASIIWIPVGVWAGRIPAVRRMLQPLVQLFAAFPANVFYPLAVILILKYQLNVEIWTMPLMILGTQWYILFNVIAGAASIPKEIIHAGKSMNLKGRLWWQRLILPAIFPYYITGAMTAAGGCWNASIAAEVVSWGDNKLIATGIGSYITQYTEAGDMPRIVLGIAIMSLYVIMINRLVWHKLYLMAEERFRI